MKKSIKRMLALMLCLIMLFGTVAVGGNGFTDMLDTLSVNASAEMHGAYGDFYYTVDNGEITITGLAHKLSNTNIIVPSTINSYPVTNIGYRAFGDRNDIVSITIPDSVTSIGEYAFFCCGNLETLNIGSGVMTIGEGAFNDCMSLSSISVSSSNKFFSSKSNFVPSGSPSGSISLKKYSVLFNKEQTELIMFPRCYPESIYTIPDSVKKIGEAAFSYCYYLKSLTIPNSVTSIGDWAFVYSSINNLNIPDSVTSIGNGAFSCCQFLKSIHIPSSVSEIGIGAFSDVDYICSNSTNCYAKKYANENGIVFKRCYTVTYNENGGSDAPGNQEKIENTALALSTKIPTRNGYDFLGWASSSSATSVEYRSGGQYTGNANVTLYAVWQEKSAETEPCVYNNNIQLEYTGINPKIYKFEAKTAGVYLIDLSTSSKVSFDDCFAMVSDNSSHLLDACASPSSLNWNGGWFKIDYFYFTQGTYNIELYNFDEDSVPNCDLEIRKIKTDVIFDANGGKGEPSALHNNYQYIVPSKIPTRTGYKFLGWNESSIATQASYIAGDSIILPINNNWTPILFAVWEKNSFTGKCEACGKTFTDEAVYAAHIATCRGIQCPICAEYFPSDEYEKHIATCGDVIVSYNANGGSGAPAAQTKTYGKDLTLSSTKPTRNGYTFLGWAETSTATAAAYQAGGKFTKDANTTLYAVWQKNAPKTYTVTYNANGGSGAPAAQTKTYGKDLTLSSTKPARTGYTFLGWAETSSATTAAYQASGKFTKDANTTLYAVWKALPEISVTVLDKNGSNIGEGAVVELYDKDGNFVAKKQTASSGICKFTQDVYAKAKFISAYKDTEHKGGPNRAAARSEYKNVVYSLRTTSDYITSSGKWRRESFNGENTKLKLSNLKIILNCSVSYYFNNEIGDYYSDIVKAFRYVNQYIQETTDGYVELGNVAVFSTNDAEAFYKKDSIAAKCDIQVRQYSSDEWGTEVWPNSSVNGALNDVVYRDEYRRIQMQKIAAGTDISSSTQTWAKIVTHELGHYFFGFRDEYINKNNERWAEIGRPLGAPGNYGLMEYQYTDLEMSVPKDYINVSLNTERYITKQYYHHKMSCWEYFDKVFFAPNGMHASIPESDRTYEEITNTVTFYDCRSNLVRAANSETQDKDSSLFVIASFNGGKILLETDKKITGCFVSTFGNENKKEIIPEKTASGYQIPLSEFDESRKFLVVESEEHINTFDVYDANLSTDEAFSNRNNSVLIRSDNSQNCGVIIYNSSNKSSQFDSFGRITALNVENGNSFTLVGRTELNGTIDYSSLSWYKYDNGEWIKLESNSSIGEYSSYETKCTVSESGIYALNALEKTAAAPSLPSDKSYFTAEAINSKDGEIKISISYSNKSVIGYKVLCQSKNNSDTITIISTDTELTIKADSPNQEYSINVWAILDSGTEISLGKAQNILSGEYYQNGSKIPYWWVVKYNLQENENEIVDNKDNDNDGYTNLQEYRNGTDPISVDGTPVYNPTANAKIMVAGTKTVDYRSIVTIKAMVTGVPEGYKLAIYLGSQKVAEGTNREVSYTYGELKSDINYTVKVIDANGKVQKDSSGKELAKDGGKITCNSGFFKKLIAFFKGIFGTLPEIEVKP